MTKVLGALERQCREQVIPDLFNGVVHVEMRKGTDIEACLEGVRTGIRQRGFIVTGDEGYSVIKGKEFVDILVKPTSEISELLEGLRTLREGDTLQLDVNGRKDPKDYVARAQALAFDVGYEVSIRPDPVDPNIYHLLREGENQDA
jgi:hypothetical protein